MVIVFFLSHRKDKYKQANKQASLRFSLSGAYFFCGMSEFSVSHSLGSVPNLDDYLPFERIPSDVGKVIVFVLTTA